MRKAFTLAEVLITLGIIGVVAAMTMPSLIAEHRERETVAKLKKVYSTLQQAYILAIQEHESPENWDWGNPGKFESAAKIMDILIPYLSVNKSCRDGRCFPDVTYRRLNGTNHTNYYKGNNIATFILNDGTALLLYSAGVCTLNNNNPDGTKKDNCGFIYADLNGKSLPNQFGKDIFGFVLDVKGIYPFGMEDYTYPFSTSCNRKKDSYLNGLGCTVWVIQNENMDYTKCDGLNFDKDTGCK